MFHPCNMQSMEHKAVQGGRGVKEVFCAGIQPIGYVQAVGLFVIGDVFICAGDDAFEQIMSAI